MTTAELRQAKEADNLEAFIAALFGNLNIASTDVSDLRQSSIEDIAMSARLIAKIITGKQRPVLHS